MRVSQEKLAENRARLLAEAARLLRERGLSGVGVDALAEAAGVTHGAVYSHFASKEALAAAALQQAMEGSGARLVPPGVADPSLAGLARRYLTAAHRDAAGTGCTLAAVAAEARHHGPPVRQAIERGVRRMADQLATLLPEAPGAARQDAALAAVATLVGSLMLARAVEDPALSEQILAAGARHFAPSP